MRGITLALGLCALIGLTTDAQSPTGTLTGIVRSPAGAPLPGVRIALARDGIPAAATVSDGRGAFTFTRLPAARYDLTATLAGFSPFTTHTVVSPGKPQHLTIVLQPAAAAPQAKAAREAHVMTAADALAQSARVPGGVVGGVVGGVPATPGPNLYPRRPPRPAWNTEAYDRIDDNPFAASRRIRSRPSPSTWTPRRMPTSAAS